MNGRALLHLLFYLLEPGVHFWSTISQNINQLIYSDMVHMK